MKTYIKSKNGHGLFLGTFLSYVFFEKDKETTPDLMEYGPAEFSSFQAAMDCLKQWAGNPKDYEIITR
jgi:hypothetical protein